MMKWVSRMSFKEATGACAFLVAAGCDGRMPLDAGVIPAADASADPAMEMRQDLPVADREEQDAPLDAMVRDLMELWCEGRSSPLLFERSCGYSLTNGHPSLDCYQVGGGGAFRLSSRSRSRLPSVFPLSSALNPESSGSTARSPRPRRPEPFWRAQSAAWS